MSDSPVSGMSIVGQEEASGDVVGLLGHAQRGGLGIPKQVPEASGNDNGWAPVLRTRGDGCVDERLVSGPCRTTSVRRNQGRIHDAAAHTRQPWASSDKTVLHETLDLGRRRRWADSRRSGQRSNRREPSGIRRQGGEHEELLTTVVGRRGRRSEFSAESLRIAVSHRATGASSLRRPEQWDLQAIDGPCHSGDGGPEFVSHVGERYVHIAIIMQYYPRPATMVPRIRASYASMSPNEISRRHFTKVHT